MADEDLARTWWAIAVNVVCFLALVILGVLYINNVASESERKWCGVVTTLDDSYAAPRPPGSPAITATGQRIIDEMRRLRREFGCPPGKG